MSYRRAIAFASTAGGVLAADQLSKALVRASFDVGQSVPVVEGALWLTRVQNAGAAFGVLAGQRWAFVAIGCAVLAGVAWALVRLHPLHWVPRAALALVAGGALGNLIDRVAFGTVTDFIDLGWFPVFNLADVALDVGVAGIVVWLLLDAKRETRSHRAAGAERPATHIPEAGECE